MQRTWVENEALRRSKDGIEKLRREISQMLAKRTQIAEDSSDGRQIGYVDCLRSSLKAVEMAELELEVYDQEFSREERGESKEISDGLRIFGTTPEEKLEQAEEDLKKFTGLKAKLSRYPDLVTQINREIEKVKEIARVAGFETYEVELVEQRVTTQAVLARNPVEARSKGMAKQGVVIDVDDSTTSQREPRVRLNGAVITKVEMDAT